MLLSHLKMVPVWLLKVSVPVLPVAQVVSLPLISPATVGVDIVTCTVSLLSAHTPLLTVHIKLYTPGCKLVTEVLFNSTLLMMVAVGPDSCDHLPLPLVGMLPASCSVSCRHIVLSDPAAAVVTAWYTVTTAVSLYSAEHTPLCTMALYHVVVVTLV